MICGGGKVLIIAPGSVCDARGNGNIARILNTVAGFSTDYYAVSTVESYELKYYDSNRDGAVDAIRIPSLWVLNKTLITSSTMTVFVNAVPQSVLEFNNEGNDIGYGTYAKISETLLSSWIRANSTLTTGFGPSITLSPTTVDLVQDAVPYLYPYVTISFFNSSTSNSPADLLFVTYSRAVNPVSVAVSNIQGLSPNLTVVSATLVSARQVAYRLQQTCLNTTVPCIDTSQRPSFTLSGIVDLYATPLSATDVFVAEDLTKPTIVGVSTAIGSATIKLLFSETISFASSFVSRASFSLHTNGLYAASVSPSTNAAEYTVTANRGIKASDLAALLQGVNVTLVDSLGNQGSDTPAAVFSFNASVHDDDDDGLVDRLRIVTSIPHFEFTSSTAFTTVPAMTLGAVTRVSSTTSDIAVTNGAYVDESVAVEYTAGGLLAARLRQRLSASGNGPLDGFEMMSTIKVADIEAPTATVTTTEEDGMSYALAGGLIGGAAVVGIVIGICYSLSSSSARIVKTKSRHRRRKQLDSDDEEEEEQVELF